MNQERFQRLHTQLNACEIELRQLDREMVGLTPSDELQTLKGRYNLLRAKMNTLQLLFNSDFEPPAAKT